MYYDWAYEHARTTYGDDRDVPKVEKVVESIIDHFEQVCEEYANPNNWGF